MLLLKALYIMSSTYSKLRCYVSSETRQSTITSEIANYSAGTSKSASAESKSSPLPHPPHSFTPKCSQHTHTHSPLHTHVPFFLFPILIRLQWAGWWQPLGMLEERLICEPSSSPRTLSQSRRKEIICLKCWPYWWKPLLKGTFETNLSTLNAIGKNCDIF